MISMFCLCGNWAATGSSCFHGVWSCVIICMMGEKLAGRAPHCPCPEAEELISAAIYVMHHSNSVIYTLIWCWKDLKGSSFFQLDTMKYLESSWLDPKECILLTFSLWKMEAFLEKVAFSHRKTFFFTQKKSLDGKFPTSCNYRAYIKAAKLML